jgi:hypothetical protein
MTERAALYTVEARPQSRGGTSLPLGDIDGAGTSLVAVLSAILDGFEVASVDGARVVRALSASADGDDLFAILQHGQAGIAADIVDPSGDVRLRQTPADLQLVRCGCLFELPPAATQGRLAAHVKDGRGIKGLVEQGLTSAFRARYPQLRLTIERLAEPALLQTAVAGDRVESLRLTRLEPAGAHTSDTARWIATGDAARLEVDLAVRSPGAHLDRTLLERYLTGDRTAFPEIARFGGLTFDRVRVGVVLADETRRLFDLEHPEAGRPAMRALDGIELDESGEPTAVSLLASLRAALAS